MKSVSLGQEITTIRMHVTFVAQNGFERVYGVTLNNWEYVSTVRVTKMIE